LRHIIRKVMKDFKSEKGKLMENKFSNRFNLALLLVMLTISISCNKSDEKTSIGPWPEDVLKWTKQDKEMQRVAGGKLQAAFNEALRRGDKYFEIPCGIYRFAQPGKPDAGFVFEIDSVSSLTIDGKNSFLYMEWKPDGREIGCFHITRSKDITIRNIFMDWDPVVYTQGKIIKTYPETTEIQWKPDPGYETIPPSMKREKPFLRSYLLDPGTKKMVPFQVRMTTYCDSRYTPDSDGSYRLRISPPNDKTKNYTPEQMGLKAGATLITHHRGGGAPFWIWESGKVTVEDVTTYASPSVTVKGKFGDGGYVFRRFNAILRPGTDRLMVSNQDGFQISNMKRGPVIEECHFENPGDDFINVGEISDDDSLSGGVIRNNVFTAGTIRGILARASNMLIENNRIVNTLEAGIVITECGPIHNLVIRGNYLEDNCGRAISGVGNCPYTTGAAIEMWSRNPQTDPIRKDIVIEGNTIVKPSGSAVSVVNAHNVTIKNNTFRECGSRPWIGKGRQPDQYGLPVGIYANTKNVVVQDNKVLYPGLYSLDQ
jgi:hypothetical protein